MTASSVLVAGQGAVGLAAALALARAGLSVTVCDPQALGDSASGVAAGMLAPVSECVLDPAATEAFELLKSGQALWTDLAVSLGIEINRCDAVMAGTSGFLASVRTKLALLGIDAAQLSIDELSRVAPAAESGLAIPGDWRLDVAEALAALYAGCAAAGVRFVSAAVVGFDDRRVRLSSGEMVPAEHLVIAAGFAPGLASLAPELAGLVPIKGQLLRAPRTTPLPRVLRGEGVYVTPSRGGVLMGATMELGRADLEPDPDLLNALRARAAALDPDLAEGEAIPAVGVRAATPDGLPLIGWSDRPGVILATGMRRNGWLLAPLAAEIVTALVLGRDLGPHATRMDARRFGRRSNPAS